MTVKAAESPSARKVDDDFWREETLPQLKPRVWNYLERMNRKVLLFCFFCNAFTFPAVTYILGIGNGKSVPRLKDMKQRGSWRNDPWLLEQFGDEVQRRLKGPSLGFCCAWLRQGADWVPRKGG